MNGATVIGLTIGNVPKPSAVNVRGVQVDLSTDTPVTVAPGGWQLRVGEEFDPTLVIAGVDAGELARFLIRSLLAVATVAAAQH